MRHPTSNMRARRFTFSLVGSGFLIGAAVAFAIVVATSIWRHDSEPASDPNADAMIDTVVVEEIDLDLAAPERYPGQLLWKAFPNQPTDKEFSSIRMKHWYGNWSKYKAELIRLAQEKGYDYQSLSRCLKKIEPRRSGGIALLPVAAFVARRGSEDVWIICCHWEEAEPDEPEVILSHLRAWAFRMTDDLQVSFTTCD